MLVFLGFRGGSDGKESICNAGDLGSIPAFYLYFSKPKSQSILHIYYILPWRRAWQPTPVFLPGESPWTEEPDGLQSTGSQGVGHN